MQKFKNLKFFQSKSTPDTNKIKLKNSTSNDKFSKKHPQLRRLPSDPAKIQLLSRGTSSKGTSHSAPIRVEGFPSSDVVFLSFLFFFNS